MKCSTSPPSHRSTWARFGKGMAAICFLALFSTVSVAAEALLAPVQTRPEVTPFYFKIPAPRGQILDCEGRPLARMTTTCRLVIEVPPLNEETPETYFLWLRDVEPKLQSAFPGVTLPEAAALEDHFKHRRKLPVPTAQTFDETYATAHPASAVPGTHWRVEYRRDYPAGTLAAHAIGYVSPVGPPLQGPLHHGEPLWREIAGKDGLESAFEEQLAGQPGLLIITVDRTTHACEQQVMIPPRAGRDVITTLHLDVQQSAEAALRAAKRPGALVVADPRNGNLLALASTPAYSPAEFARGISKEKFDELIKDRDGPLHHRAVAGQYPPGSVFKPFVALACLKTGQIQPQTRLLCGPSLEIDGRKFRNWSETDAGYFDLQAAMVRSCNTYFYQAALATGGTPVLEAAGAFGFGNRDPFPLTASADGELPNKVPNRQALANLSIGQGEVLATPLQVTMAMAALANGVGRLQPRLVSHVQSPHQEVTEYFPPVIRHRLDYRTEDLDHVRVGMYGVVNHTQGTGTKARLEKQRVFGKTGTAEWSSGGRRANIIWFAGFLMDCQPPLAYALALEGKPGEKVSGGQTAAPVLGSFLNAIFQDPARHGIRPGKPAAPLLKEPLFQPPPPPSIPSAIPVTATMPAPVLAEGNLPLDAFPPSTQAVPAMTAPPQEPAPASPPIRLTARSSSDDMPAQQTVIPDPAAAPSSAVPTQSRSRTRTSPSPVVTRGNGVVATAPAPRTRSITSRHPSAPAPAPPPPVGEPAPPVRVAVAEPVTAEIEMPLAVPSEPQRSKGTAKAPLPRTPVPKAQAVEDARAPASPPTPTPPRALPIDPSTAPPAQITQPAPQEPKRRRFRLFGDDDEDEDKPKKDKDDDDD